MERENITANHSVQTDKQNYLFNFKNEINHFNAIEVKKIAQKLNYLCLNYDPYQPFNIGTEEKNIIEEFQLSQYLDNPFEYTRIILQMLDIIETKMKKSIH